MNESIPDFFDYKFYSDYHTDLKEAFGENEFLLKRHYLKHGQFENRKYCNIPDDFDWKKYILANPSFFPNMEDKTKRNSITHFLKNHYNQDKSYDDYKLIGDISYKPIIIVYYAFLNNDRDWKAIVLGQINDIYNSKILSVVYKFHLVVLGDKNDIEELKNILKSIINVEIEYTELYKNKYEFPAMKKIRDLALENQDKLFIYLHSKGMSYSSSEKRNKHENVLTLKTILDWETTLFIFENFPEINKAGLSPAKEGHVWFNFWWARGSYLANCEPIIMKEHYEEKERYICETWLGESGNKSCKDIYSMNKKTVCEPIIPGDDRSLWSDVWQILFYY